jgi:hypothetical protein
MRIAGLAGLFTFLTLSTALSAPATQDEAKRLTSLFESYIGDIKGVVRVVPAGEAYDVTVDYTPLLSLLPQNDQVMEISPVTMKLADQGGDKWLITSDKPFGFKMKVVDQLDISVTSDAINYEAVFDAKLGFFVSSEMQLSNLIFAQTVTTSDGSAGVSYTLKSVDYTSTNSETSAGIVDGKGVMTFSGMEQTIKATATEELPTPLNFTLKGEKGSQVIAFKGLNVKAVYDIVKFLATKAKSNQKEFSDADFVELQPILKSSLPFFQNINMQGTFDNLQLETMLGTFGLSSVSSTVEMNGLVKDGLFREAISLEGLTIPKGIVPDIYDQFMPEKLAFDFQLTGFDLNAPALLALDKPKEFVDFEDDPAFSAQLLEALLPTGAVTFTLNSSKFVGKTYDIEIDGSVTGGETVKPVGKGMIKAKPLNELIAAVQALPAEMELSQLSAGLIAFNSIAKKQPDGSLIWDIDGDGNTNKYLINSIDFGSLASLAGLNAPTPETPVDEAIEEAIEPEPSEPPVEKAP